MDEEYLRHNYAARVASERAKADEHGEPPLVKAARVWEDLDKPVEEETQLRLSEGQDG